MEFRRLRNTDMDLSTLSFGASSLGAEFRAINLDEAFRSVHVALERGMNFIDTSPFYGRGMSEMLLGRVLPDIPRDSYYLQTKLGRYTGEHFDFSAKRVAEVEDHGDFALAERFQARAELVRRVGADPVAYHLRGEVRIGENAE